MRVVLVVLIMPLPRPPRVSACRTMNRGDHSIISQLKRESKWQLPGAVGVVGYLRSWAGLRFFLSCRKVEDKGI